MQFGQLFNAASNRRIVASYADIDGAQPVTLEIAITSETAAADLAYQARKLNEVSRTFALTIPQLPGGLRDVVGNAYLLCRIADTIEDEPALPAKRKKEFSERFVDVVAGRQDAWAFAREVSGQFSSSTPEGERDLIANTARVIRITRGFRNGEQQALVRCVRIMTEGMVEFQFNASRNGLVDLKQLDRYCYHVAGIVGETLTELFCIHSREIRANRRELLELSVSFGQGLQMTNILKDMWEDRSRGACWLPRDVFLASGLDLGTVVAGSGDPKFAGGLKTLVGIARQHLRNALRFVQMIPSHETGIRRHCLWSLGMAVLTLRRIHAMPEFTSGEHVKISRFQVKAVVVVTSLLARSNLALSLVFNALTRRLA